MYKVIYYILLTSQAYIASLQLQFTAMAIPGGRYNRDSNNSELKYTSLYYLIYLDFDESNTIQSIFNQCKPQRSKDLYVLPYALYFIF